ncbi:MAG: hypothetical protein IIC63_06800 [Proteobacteria bacterium]|nr:hypothetical protein [Pseudomonadota bacterium]
MALTGQPEPVIDRVTDQYHAGIREFFNLIITADNLYAGHVRCRATPVFNRRQKAIDSGQPVVVGVNRFRLDDQTGDNQEIPTGQQEVLKIDPAWRTKQIERLERVKEILHGQPGQKLVDSAIWPERHIVEAPNVKPLYEIVPSDFGIDRWRPGHRERVHAIFVFQHVCRVCAVFSPAARDQAVVAAIVVAMPVQELNELFLSITPVNLFLEISKAAGVADSVIINLQGWCLPFRGMSELRI